MAKLSFILLVTINFLRSQTFDVLDFVDPHATIHGGYESNWWFPHITPLLKYKTQGFNNGYLNVRLRHNIYWIPDINLNWSTNFNMNSQSELLNVNSQATNLEQGYNQIKSSFLFMKRTNNYVNASLIDSIISQYQILELDYTKETYLIAVTSQIDALKYAAYYSDKIYSFNKEMSLTSYTKFQELSISIHDEITPKLYGIELNPNHELRFGLFYATLNKPFAGSQISGDIGNISPEPDKIYNATYRFYGIKQEFRIYGKEVTKSVAFKIGIGNIKLKKNLDYNDSKNPEKLYWSFAFDLPFYAKITPASGVIVVFGGEYSAQYGSRSDTTGYQTNINSDYRIKISTHFHFNL